MSLHAKARTLVLRTPRSHIAIATLLLAPLLPAAARGQAASSRTWGFVAARIDSRFAHYVYTGYGYAAIFAVGALVDNPRTGYTEQILGAGVRLPLHAHDTQFAVIAICNASDARYVQLYYLPSLTIGRLAAGATFEAYVPLDTVGISQFAITSLTVTTHVRGPLSAGFAYELSAAQRARTAHGVGGAVRLGLPHAELGADAMHGLGHAPAHLRLSFRAFY